MSETCATNGASYGLRYN